jgi:truncated hemoglobin YjbI
MNSYVKIYNAWLKGMDSVAREGYEIGQKASIGEEVETARFFETLKAAYDGITASVVESLKDTPFAGLKGLDKAVKDALDSLPEEQKMAREFLQELFSFSVKMTNLSTEVMKEVSKTSADMLAKGTISGEGYKNLIDAYGETLKHSVEILQEKAALLPGYKDIADDATSWAKANLDLSISWLEMNLKLYQGMAKSSKDISKTAEELFKGEKISSADELQKRWLEAYQQALDVLVKDAQFSENISKLMNSYAEWMKSTTKLYRSVMTPPYAAKEDFDRVSEELAKVKRTVKSSVEKRATAKVDVEEK